jgi:hypothetical protein
MGWHIAAAAAAAASLSQIYQIEDKFSFPISHISNHINNLPLKSTHNLAI